VNEFIPTTNQLTTFMWNWSNYGEYLHCYYAV